MKSAEKPTTALDLENITAWVESTRTLLADPPKLSRLLSFLPVK
ncbi:hypothetical protein AM202_04127 [Actinobacillus minor 202]|uniref:Uncharacterized protein n=1 Tax=Actinobacillus minor 202 TaxID=591023 RepID=A0ABP2GUG4_9PAST|nr:hypothetical protein AM202_04127 [Actinobacillus minor 202]